MKDKLRELAEWMRGVNGHCADALTEILDAEGDGGAVGWQIETDDDVERVAKESGWDNRRYMTPADYSIWCIRMREFVRIAVDVPQPFTTHPGRSGVVRDEDVRDAERLDFVEACVHALDWDGDGMKLVIVAHDGSEYKADTYREAIDKATQGQKS